MSGHTHLLGRISPIFSPFFPVFCAFSPSRRGGSTVPQAGTQGQETAAAAAAVTRFRPYLAHFSPVFSRFLRVVTVSPRRFQQAAKQPSVSSRKASSGESCRKYPPAAKPPILFTQRSTVRLGNSHSPSRPVAALTSAGVTTAASRQPPAAATTRSCPKPPLIQPKFSVNN